MSPNRSRMRAPIRREDLAARYVAIGRIEALRALEADNQEARIGACATHAEIAEFLSPFPEFEGLRAAAGNSANPAVRNVATIGGNGLVTLPTKEHDERQLLKF